MRLKYGKEVQAVKEEITARYTGKLGQLKEELAREKAAREAQKRQLTEQLSVQKQEAAARLDRMREEHESEKRAIAAQAESTVQEVRIGCDVQMAVAQEQLKVAKQLREQMSQDFSKEQLQLKAEVTRLKSQLEE